MLMYVILYEIKMENVHGVLTLLNIERELSSIGALLIELHGGYICATVALTRVSLCLYLENMEFFFLRITRIAATMAIFVQHTPDACSLCMWYANVFPSM